MRDIYILAINPGSTTTKIALFNESTCVKSENIQHNTKEIDNFDTIYDQKGIRVERILKWIDDEKVNIGQLSAIVGRGGLLRPMPGGTYKITDKLIEDLKLGYQGQHASNLGGIIAKEISDKFNIPSFIVDPVSVDEMDDVARISGMVEIERKSLVHALNIKAIARRCSKNLNKDFLNSSYVVAHLGGGISIVPLKNGRILDVNNANEEGPFSPERCGGLPWGKLSELCFSTEYTEKELGRKFIGKGGMVAYLGTNDGREVEKLIKNGHQKSKLIFEAMAYQISKEIGAMATVLFGNLDSIILTGGLAYNTRLTSIIKDRIEFIAPVEILPGEDEMLALVEGALRVIKGNEEAKIYEEEVHIND